MKNSFILFFLCLFLSAGVFTSCNKDDEEPTPDPVPNAKVFKSVMTTANGGNSGDAIVSGTVSTSDGTVKLRLEVTSTEDLDRIYIMKSEDNGPLQGVTIQGDIKNADGKEFKGGTTDYTLKVPTSTKSFTVDIPVSVRTNASAVTDAYQIWITKGAGDFLIPSKRRVLGQSVIILEYKAGAADDAYTQFSGTVGNQQATEPSFIVTSGQGGVIGQADYKNNDNPENAKSVDIAFSTLATTLDALGAEPALLSPSERVNVGFNASNEPDAANVNTTYFGTWSGVAFSEADGDDLDGISGLTAKKILVSSGSTYAFVTQAGKKGLINVTSIAASGSGKKLAFSIKVLN